MVSPNSAWEFGFRGGALMPCFALDVARIVRVAGTILHTIYVCTINTAGTTTVVGVEINGFILRS